MLDKFLFHSKHWQLFLVFVTGLILLNLFDERAANIFATVIYLIWLPLLGVRLKKFLPSHYNFHYRMFLVAWPTLIIVGSYSMLISDHRGDDWIDAFLSVLLTYSFFTILAFIARAIKSLQTNDRATVNDYFWDIFLLFGFPIIGVWFIQPRLNLLGDQFYR